MTQDVLGQLGIAQMKRDVLVLRRGLEKNHPGLYWYTPKERFDSAWNGLTSRIDRPMSKVEFFKLLLPIVADVQCAHTLLYPSPEMMAQGKRFPLHLKFRQGKGYILDDSGNNIPRGSELVSVNGKSLEEIVTAMLYSLQAQGGNLGWKYVLLENDFQNYYYYLIEQSNNFVIDYIDPQTKQEIQRELQGSSDDKLKTYWSQWYPTKDGAPLSISFPTSYETAIITIRSLSKGRYKMYHQDFKRLLANYFKEIKEKAVKKLIIDMRGNEGGNNPDFVYSYIARPADRNVNSHRDFIKPAKNAFQGQVFILTNERSISSQEAFVAIFKNNERGLTIGLPTAGSYNGLCGGKKRKVILPNSGFEIIIPLHATIWAFSKQKDYQMGYGLPPDIHQDETIDDLIAGRDVAMQVALTK